MQMRRAGHLAALLFWVALTPVPGVAQSTDVLLNCTSCHSLNNTDKSIYPNLNGQPATYLKEQLDAYRTGKRIHTQMQNSAMALGEGGAAAMARMYADAPAPTFALPPEDRYSDARTLEASGAWDRGIAPCASCHIPPTQTQNTLPPNDFPRIHGQPEGYIVSTLRAYADGLRTTGGMGRMQAYAGAMTDAEITAIAAYLAAFTPKQDRP